MSPAASAFGGQELLRLLAFDTELPEHLHGLDRVPGVSRQPRPSAREARRAAGRRRRVTQCGLDHECTREEAVCPLSLVAGVRAEEEVQRAAPVQARARADGGRGRAGRWPGNRPTRRAFVREELLSSIVYVGLCPG
jgi:hypothetical protein